MSLIKMVRSKAKMKNNVTNVLGRRDIIQLGLNAKLHEEAAEVIKDPANAEEYGDTLQVLMDMAQLNGLTWDEVEKARYKKGCRKGRFLGYVHKFVVKETHDED